MKVKQLGNIVNTGNFSNPQRGRIYSTDGICPALVTVTGGGLEHKILESKEQIIVASRRRDVDGGTEQKLEPNLDGISNSLTTVEKDNYVMEKIGYAIDQLKLRIRKLTPKETFRLMGFTDDDHAKCVALGVSDSQLYRQAGNSIVTNCISLIFEHLYKAQYNSSYACSDEKFLADLEEKEGGIRQ